MAIESIKSKLEQRGWNTSEFQAGALWRVTARCGEHVVLSQSLDRTKSWIGVLEVVNERPCEKDAVSK